MTKKYLEAVLILGKDVITSDKKLIDKFAKNPSYKVIGSIENGFELADLELLKGKINHQTKIIIHDHGAIYNKEHIVQANRGLYTKEILQKLQSFSDRPLNIILESCFSGSAQYLVKYLHKGSVLVTTSKENSYSIFAFSLFEFENNQSNLFNDFLINMPKWASTYSKFITNKISFELKPEYKHILDTELAREFLNKNADNFIKFVQENYFITLSKPQYALDDISFFQKAFFIYSCALGESTFSEYLLKEQIHFKENDELIKAKVQNLSALYMASHVGHREIVELLIAAEADVNQAKDGGVTPLYIASQEGHREIVKLLIAAEANVNQAMDDGATPLYIASRKGHKEIVKLLIAARADVNQADNNGVIPLYIASQNGYKKIVKLLIAAKSDVNQAVDGGATPLYIASHNGYTEIVELFITAKADVNQAKDGGVTPLHMASQNGYKKIVELLITAKADVNQAKDDGVTPLHIASQNGYREIVKLLLKHKDINVNQTYEGHTAIDVACSLNHLEVAKALLAAGAYPNIDIPSTREYALLNKEIELFKNEPVKYILDHNINSNLAHKALNNLKHNELFNNSIIKLDKVIECFDNHANDDDLNLLEICGSNIDYTDEL